MANLKNIKLKIDSVKKTRQVTRAMEAVSAVKMRKTQQQALNARPYAASALSILKRLSGSSDLRHHPLAKVQPGKTCIVVVTSDKGLAGALNSNITRTLERVLRDLDLTPGNVVVFAIGRRGAEFFAARKFTIHTRLENMSDNIEESQLRTIADDVLALHTQGEISRCLVVYTNFLSTFEQHAVMRTVLPLSFPMLHEMVSGIVPVKGKFTEVDDNDPAPAAYTIEPSRAEVLAELMPKLFQIMLFHTLAEAKASEHSARMVAMKNATDKALEVAHDLTLAFNKVRQSAITAEVSEITSGIEAMR